MDNFKYLKPMIGLSLLVGAAFSGASTAGDDQAAMLAGNQPVISFGLGQSIATVSPNTNDQYYDGRGLGIGVGISAERGVSGPFALAARVDMFNSIALSTIASSADASWGLMATAGFILGNRHQPGQLYLSASIGGGVAVLSDQGLDHEGNSVCTLCTGKEGGASAGLAGRLAVGIVIESGQRVELVMMRAGGDGNDDVYSNGEDAFLQTIMLQISS